MDTLNQQPASRPVSPIKNSVKYHFGWEDDASSQNYIPWKPIHMASLWGFDCVRVPVAIALALAGTNLNSVSPLDGFRPIHLVSMSNRVDIIRFLGRTPKSKCPY